MERVVGLFDGKSASHLETSLLDYDLPSDEACQRLSRLSLIGRLASQGLSLAAGGLPFGGHAIAGEPLLNLPTMFCTLLTILILYFSMQLQLEASMPMPSRPPRTLRTAESSTSWYVWWRDNLFS